MKKMERIKKVIAVLIITILVALQATTVSAAWWGSSSNTNSSKNTYTYTNGNVNTNTNTTEATTQKQEDIEQYQDFIEEIQNYLSGLDTSSMQVDDLATTLIEKIKELQNGEYSGVSGVDEAATQLMNKILSLTSSSDDTTDVSTMISSLSSTLSSLLGNTSVSLESMTVNETVTISADTAVAFAGSDYAQTLSANIYESSANTDKWVVLIHGFMMNGQAMADAIGDMYIDNYNILAVDLRGAGNTGGTTAMGFIEALDMYDWLVWLNADDNEYISSKPEEIIVHGISLGGATTLFLSGISELINENEEGWDLQTLEELNVVGLVDDCGYTSMVGILQDLLGTVANAPLISSILGIVGFDLSSDSTVETLQNYLVEDIGIGLTTENASTYQDAMKSLEYCTVPILIIHGQEDTTVPPTNGERVWELVTGTSTTYTLKHSIDYAQIFRAEGLTASHAFISIGIKATEYEDCLDTFIEAIDNNTTGYVEYEYTGSESTSFISTLVKALKLIKNIFGF